MQGSESLWLPNPPKGTSVCGGFDGSENDDHTVIKLETREGFIFTPRYGPDRRPTIWNPAEWDGKIPRHEVNEAWAEIARTFRILRVYADPGFFNETDYRTEIEDWDQKYGPDVFVEWPTNILGRMYPALRRFEADLKNGAITHDGCPRTNTHMANARKIPKGERYYLGKPAQHQKIDASMGSVLTHEAAADMRAEGWPEPGRVPEGVSTRMYGFT
ncbi:phage terminase large subunit-like protein [Aeromicrobium sp. SORGH_AS981]|uniref:terminase n=1 Tax=Aeromicrobium sp. SORGH_AS_0981 TaxID=3041802 RepID=UPI0028675B28|nr:terminase [Aeromicrobium sp. SORGH_AS_0981]MDR6117262.1 phage terminase large subunit-like protein [Aeromicrobium sp. SORGH_AS_0981]